MDSVAEQRATAVAKLKRAASLPRMKDGRRPPMHVEAVSEGERSQDEDHNDLEYVDGDEPIVAGHYDSTPERDEERRGEPNGVAGAHAGAAQAQGNLEGAEDEKPEAVEYEKADELDTRDTATPVNEGTPTRSKRRSRSRTRSRGSKDLRSKAAAKLQQNAASTSHTNESSADEYHLPIPGEDAPPSPPVISPVPSYLPIFPGTPFLRSPLSPVALYYPGTTPSTPLPSLDDIQKGVGLYRSNSAGAARAMALQKLTGEPLDLSQFPPSPASPGSGGARLARNNTVAGGERLAARKMLLNRLNNRINQGDGEMTSGGEEPAPQPAFSPTGKRRRRRSKRSSSRASTVVDDRDERELPSTTPTTPQIPPSPLPLFMRHTPEPPRAPSSLSRLPNGETERPSPRIITNGNLPVSYETPLGRRGPVIEDEDDAPASPVHPPLPTLPVTPSHRQRGFRLPHTSDAPSNASTDSASPNAVGVPVFLSHNPSVRQDFPASPFATPFKEKPLPDEEDEQVIYQESRSRSRLATTHAFERESEISWIADPVPERVSFAEDDDDDDDEPEADIEEDVADENDDVAPDSAGQRSSMEFGQDQPRPNLVLDVETSPEMGSAHIPPSPASLTGLFIPGANDGVRASPVTYPMRLSVATPNQLDRSASGNETDWDDSRPDSTPKRTADGMWDKVKGTFTRMGSSTGRRSRTNSLSARDRRYNTDSSVSRESGASLTSGKVDKPDSPTVGVFAVQQVQPPLMSPSASGSALSLAPQSAPPGGLSPVPPVSPADLLRYADSKLFPFPGMKQLEEQRNRTKGVPFSSSNPDVTSQFHGFPMESIPSTSTASGTTTRLPEGGRERKLSHQASDSRLLAKYSQPLASAPSTSSQHDYFQQPSAISPSVSSGSAKLPTSREGVRKWLKIFGQSTPSTPNPEAPRQPDARTKVSQKPSLSDLLMSRKESELSAKWDDVDSDKSRTPTNVTTSRIGQVKDKPPVATPMGIEAQSSQDSGPHGLPSPDGDIHAGPYGPVSPSFLTSSPNAFSSPPDPPSSTTPDPQSSLDDFPARSTSASFSSEMSSSHHSPDPLANRPSVGTVIMDRLEEVLGRGSKSSLWPSAFDDPPRKPVLTSPVLQVVNANTVKDRFLFLFSDILVICKPIVNDYEALLDGTKPSPSDRKYIVKSVVLVKELRFTGERERDEAKTKLPSTMNPMRHPIVRGFVHQFAQDPDTAVSTFFEKTTAREDHLALGQLLFRAVDLDRARLGEYLARRNSKAVLKSFVDCFGMTGLRVDKALRVFLQSLHVPDRSNHSNPLEYLLDSFASRWYEANASIVAYGKDLAIKLVRAIVQLNEIMHGGIAEEPGMTGYPKRNILAKDFIDAFRRTDPRYIVPDDLLDKIYSSIRREKLAQAPNAAHVGRPDIPITIKRPLPPRLTYRMKSEPIILRISQPDPQLTIQLFGQDLEFEPSVLNFAKSSEASFRVTGNALGSKTIIMWRSGPNALAYSGLPLSSTVVVERAFMRNTFQIAFLNHTGLKRKYMFSVDDPLLRHQWTTTLKRQIEVANSVPTAPHLTLRSHRAAEALAFKVLQDTLISQDDGSENGVQAYPSPIDQALARLAGIPTTRSRSGSTSSAFGAVAGHRNGGGHNRSKSRSQLYPRHGAGRDERELDEGPDSQDERGLNGSASLARPDGRLWSGHDLEVVCRQNSSIPAVLSYFLVGVSDNPYPNGAGS